MNWEIITFIAYFVILLGVALVFYFNGTNQTPRTFFWVDDPWDHGLRHCPHRRQICPHGC